MPLELALQKGCISEVEAMPLPRAPSPHCCAARGAASPRPPPGDTSSNDLAPRLANFFQQLPSPGHLQPELFLLSTY